MAGLGVDQGAGAPSAEALRSTGEPGKASPIRRGGRVVASTCCIMSRAVQKSAISRSYEPLSPRAQTLIAAASTKSRLSSKAAKIFVLQCLTRRCGRIRTHCGLTVIFGDARTVACQSITRGRAIPPPMARENHDAPTDRAVTESLSIPPRSAQPKACQLHQARQAVGGRSAGSTARSAMIEAAQRSYYVGRPFAERLQHPFTKWSGGARASPASATLACTSVEIETGVFGLPPWKGWAALVGYGAGVTGRQFG
jgi:hypothetical protein